MKLPHAKKPCNNCPFRKDSLKGWLGKERMKGILKSPSFVCHKTSEGNDINRKQCAGHMIIKKEDNEFYRMALRVGLKLDLRGQELVFNNDKDCISHHE